MDIENVVKATDMVFSDYLSGKINNTSLCDHLSRILSSFDNGKHITVYVINPKRSDQIFFMRTAPIIDDGMTIIDEIKEEDISFKKMNERWSKLENWVIEIDIRTFDRTIISFNPQELTAMLLHEIGHVIYSDRVVEKFYRMFMETKLKFTMAERSKFKILTCIYLIPLYTACVAHELSIGKNGIIEERMCDSLTRSVRYHTYLISAFDKIIKAYGTNYIIKDESVCDKEVEKDMIWAGININELSQRRDKLKSELVFKFMNTNSNIFKKAYSEISNKIGVYIKNKKNNESMGTLESFFSNNETIDMNTYDILIDYKKSGPLFRLLDNYDDKIATEGLSLLKKDKPISMSDYDIDCIEVEIDRIQNHHDRMFVLDLIYNALEKIDTIESLMDVNIKYNKYRNKIEPWRKRLAELRTMAMKKKDFSSNYTLFVRQVPGYEG